MIDNIINLKSTETEKVIVKSDEGTGISNIERTVNSRTPITKEEQEQLDKYIEDKYYEYLKHNPILQIDGKGNLNNYTTFLYENGIMPSDRFNYKRLHQIKSDRAFVFDVENFETFLESIF